MTDDQQLAELSIALDPRHSSHSLPLIAQGEKVLDVGCGAGQALIAACPYRTAGEGGLCIGCSRSDCPTWGHGIDVDESALRLSTQWTRRMVIRLAAAERLPYPDGEFDVVMSRVALPYTDIPQSIAEIRRVLRPGGRIWISMHPFSIVTAMAKRMNWKGLVFLSYIALNGVWFHFTLRTFPLFGRRESWQTAGAMRRLLERAGFRDIVVEQPAGQLIVKAIRF